MHGVPDNSEFISGSAHRVTHSEHLRPESADSFVSSWQAGWAGLVATGYHEPHELEKWLLPASSDIFLTLYTGGAIHFEWRQLRGEQSWTGFTAQPGDLGLREGADRPYELRWRCLTSAPTTTFMLQLNRSMFDRTVEEATGRDAAHLTLLSQRGFRDPLLTEISMALWSNVHDGAPTGKLFAECATQLLTLHLIRQYSARSTKAVMLPIPSHGLTTQQLHRVTAYIRDQLCEDLTLDVLARHIGFSPYHFARLFRQTTGKTPHQFVLQERLAHAQHLMETTTFPVAYVAALSGFTDQSAFARAFKRLVGVTPLAYRRERTI